jgi:hypothetical protein
MKILRRIRVWALASLLGAVAFTATGTNVQAGHYCSHCHYEWVISYVPKQVPYRKVFTEYDYYGYPHYVTKTFWKTIRVPVKKWTLVCY